MEKTDAGTTVGVADPYAYVKRCDHCTDEGRCRFAVEHGDRDPAFADRRSAEDFQCPVVGDPRESGLSGPWSWSDCPHMRSLSTADECARCGLAERRSVREGERSLLEEHHLSYAEERRANRGVDNDRQSDDPSADTLDHEITVMLCRWCHAKVHNSWAGLDDPANPDPEAIAARERRRSRELSELDFESAAQRRED